MRQRRIIKWTGNATWAAGEQSTTKWIVATGWTIANHLGTLGTSPTLTLESQAFRADMADYEYATWFCYAKKTAHAESVTFATRNVYVWAGVTPELMTSVTSRPGAGHYLPFLHQPSVGLANCGQLGWDTNHGGILSGQALNAYNLGLMSLLATNNGAIPAGAVFGCFAAAMEFATGATVLAGTNTWAVTCGFILG